LLFERKEHPERWSERRAAGIAQAARFSWAEYAKRMMTIYQELL
jgi:glycosyltransferase involved in cell wall biosynthesis